MKVLIACEESQTVCKAFRAKGHETYSADLQDCSGGHPEWHIQGDVLPLLNGNCNFVTRDGKRHEITGKWDLIIAHPPCTYLSKVATRAFSLKCTAPEKVCERWENRAKAAVFFMQCMLADCDKLAVENPIGFMSKAYRKPDQIIDPYYFTESEAERVFKHTCLWLKNLPPLMRSRFLAKPVGCSGKWLSGKNKSWTEINHSPKIRSKTFEGIAKAMAEQWG